MKNRLVIPIRKPGKPANKIKSYRPISLTSYFSKIFEKIICIRIVNFVIHLRLLAKNHFGYLRARSCQDAVTYLVDNITNNYTKKKSTHSVFFDFSAAFDCVRTNILLWKLEYEFHIRGKMLIILTVFFKDRFSAVSIGTTLSSWTKDIIGVPQGGALSPILFILYINELSIIAFFPCLKFIIYADDLCLATKYNKAKKRKTDNKNQHKQLMQFSVWWIQCYSAYLGLNLNKDKTKYQIFSRKKNYNTFNLYFDTTISQAVLEKEYYTYPEQNYTQLIHKEKIATRYLGFYMDKNLNWEYHIEQMKKKMLITWNGIEKNLKNIWKISTDTITRIIDACVFSIMDYSAIFFHLFTKKQTKQLAVIYRKYITKIIRTYKGTPTHTIQRQLGFLTFEHRWQQISVNYTTHLTRAPKSGLIYDLIKNKWWNPIKTLFTTKGGDKFPKIDSNIQRKYKNMTITTSSHIFQLYNLANLYECSDKTYIQKNTKYEKINAHETSYYLDFSGEHYNINYDEQPFKDEEIFDDEEDLLVFTDGSVKNYYGGSGIFAIKCKNYQTLLHNQVNPEKWVKDNENIYKNDETEIKNNGKTKYRENEIFALQATDISNRTSIDFCEAIAIRDIIFDLAQYITKAVKINKPYMKWARLSKTNNIRIISDSLTVLKWINGEYRLKNEHMQNIVEDICWNANILKDYNYKITFQWVKAHENTLGNEIADILANKGREQIDEKQIIYNSWSFISKKSINNMNNRFFENRDYNIWLQNAHNSRFGKENYRFSIGCKSDTHFQLERKYLSRQRMRLLISLRSGHDKCNYHQYTLLNKGTSDICDCCNENKIQDFKHLLLECNNTLLQLHRTILKNKLHLIYRSYYQTHKVLWEYRRSLLESITNELDTDMGLYLYPPMDLQNEDLRLDIINSVLDFYQDAKF